MLQREHSAILLTFIKNQLSLRSLFCVAALHRFYCTLTITLTCYFSLVKIYHFSEKITLVKISLKSFRVYTDFSVEFNVKIIYVLQCLDELRFWSQLIFNSFKLTTV